MKYLLLLLCSFNAFALEVIKPDYSHKKIVLKIVQAYPDSWETYTLVNHNSREMLLICADNRIYDNNKYAYIQYRNFYNEKAAQFLIKSNEVCKELGRFIEQAHMAIDQEQGFEIVLSRSNFEVEKITYPNLDPLSDDGDFKDLFPKDRIVISYDEKKKENSKKKIKSGTFDKM